jgi:signal transduction histidine kinase
MYLTERVVISQYLRMRLPGMDTSILGKDPNDREQSILLSIICLTIGILSADLLIPLGFVIWILYLVPLLMSVWLTNRYAPFYIAWLLTSTLLVGSLISQSALNYPSDLPNRAIFILMLAIVALLSWEIKNNYASVEAEITERRIAQARLETLTATLEERVALRTRELSDVNSQLTRDIEERRRIEAALATANAKLKLLSEITRHDLSNRIFALLVDIDLAKDHAAQIHDDTLRGQLASIEKTTYSIQCQVGFTKDYQDIGSQIPVWHRVGDLVKAAAEQLDTTPVSIDINVGRLEIFADPMVGKVFYNLIDNALRHGEHVTRITFSCQRELETMILICEDDGTGIPEKDKQHIFTKGFGRDSGLGLFLIHEILAITGISIRETGVPGKGARFEIYLEKETFRLPPE